jgi:predicted DNA-binding transcriptional regulator YafY
MSSGVHSVHARKGVKIMSRTMAFERFQWFHGQVRDGKFPNTTSLSEQFKVSSSTAQRDIQFISERLGAPLRYNSSRRGYFYIDNDFELPVTWFFKDEVITFVLLRNLVATFPDRHIEDAFKSFLKKISTYYPSINRLELEKLTENITLKNNEYFSVDEVLFNKVLHALISERTLEIKYYSPYKDESTERRIVPLHLLNLMGDWHLIAYCERTHALRGFELSRIQFAGYAKHRLPLPGNLPKIEDFLDKQFGIASGKKSVAVSLRFTPMASKRIKEQVWHPAQKTKWDRRGRLTLTVPVADYRGIKSEVLKLGDEVEVIKPAALRREIMHEIDRMVGLYR